MKGLLVVWLGLWVGGCGARSELELGAEEKNVDLAAGGASPSAAPPACAANTPGTLLWSTLVNPSFCSAAHAVVRSDAAGEARVEISQGRDWLVSTGDTLPPGLLVDLASLDARGKQRWNVSVGRVPFSGVGARAVATDGSGSARVLTPQPIESEGQPVLSTVSETGVRAVTPLTKNSTGRWWPVAVRTDRDLDTVMLGVASNDVDLGGGLLAAQEDEFFVAKLDDQNAHQWSRVFGGPVTQVDLDVEAAGSMTLAGLLRGEVTFGDMSFSSDGVGLFVATLEADGEAIFSHLLRSPNTPVLLGVARDAERNSYIAAGFDEMLDVGDAVLAGPQSSSVLIKYDATGALRWTRMLGQQSAFALGLSALGEPLVVASTPHGVDLGDGFVSTDPSMYVAKLGPDGSLIWSTHLPGASYFAPSVAPGTCGSVLVAGVFKGAFQTGARQLASQRRESCHCEKWGSGTREPCGAALVMSFSDPH